MSDTTPAITTAAITAPEHAALAEAAANAAAEAAAASAAEGEELLLTIVLSHHAGLTLDEVQQRLKASGWWAHFPPPGVRIVSWTVAMGLGHIATLALPPRLLPALNLELERRAWGVFSTACYPTYDFVPVRERIQERVRQGGQ